MKLSKYFWGLFFIGASAVIITSALGYMEGVNLVSLIFTILLIK